MNAEDKVVHGRDIATIGAQIVAALAAKQNTLVSGTNIKTINNESILGQGNIEISGGDTSVCELLANKVTSLSSSSTDTQYPSAKAVYSLIGDIESVLNAIIVGQDQIPAQQ